MLNTFKFNNFLGKAVFSEETAKNCSVGAFDHFLKKRGRLKLKIKITFLIMNHILDTVLLNKFPEKSAKNH